MLSTILVYINYNNEKETSFLPFGCVIERYPTAATTEKSIPCKYIVKRLTVKIK